MKQVILLHKANCTSGFSCTLGMGLSHSRSTYSKVQGSFIRVLPLSHPLPAHEPALGLVMSRAPTQNLDQYKHRVGDQVAVLLRLFGGYINLVRRVLLS